MAWASGEGLLLSVKPVVGASGEVMICFGMVESGKKIKSKKLRAKIHYNATPACAIKVAAGTIRA